MQPLRLAANPEAGLIHVLDRCRRHLVAHGIGEALEALGTVLADPRDGRGDQVHAKQVGHQCGQALLRQQLIVQQIQHEGANPFAVLHRRGHPVGKRRPRLRIADCATAAMRAVLGDDQRLWFGEIKYLPGDVVGRHRRRQRRAARRAGLRIMVDRGVRCRGPTQRLTPMSLLPAGLLA